MSSNVLETIKNAEEFIELREYRTAAAILTVVLQQPDDHDPQLLASLYCRRAECLLHMVSADARCTAPQINFPMRACMNMIFGIVIDQRPDTSLPHPVRRNFSCHSRL